MEESDIEFLRKLVDTPTPTGSEAAGALLLGRWIKEKTGIQPTIDVHGNLHAVYDVGAKRTVMLEGHGDEIGYMVEYIDSKGFVYLRPIGGLVVPLSAAERIRILTKNGVVNGVADTGWRKLAGTRVSGRGFDNRCGTFAMCRAFIRLATAAEPPKVNVHYVSSVCEEIGLVGGRVASYSVHPDIGICCDVTFATDMDGDDKKVVGDVRLGAGGALSVGPIYHGGLRDLFIATAQAKDIPMQIHGVPKGTGNNGWSLKLEHGGAAVAQIAIPLRYMHSPVEVIDLKDVDSVSDLVTAAVLGLDDSFGLLPEQP